MTRSDDSRLSRRRVLRGLSGTVGVAGLATGTAAAGGSTDRTDECPEATVRPEMVHYDDSVHEVCADDAPETRALQEDVRASLESNFPTVGSLIDAGFVPYFDFFADGSWSHWLNPEFLGDDSVVDADRPESILVDHTYWRPIGVMFIATADGDRVDPPPSVYEDADGRACTPWHAHVGLAGRYAWWKYRKAYHGDPEVPCRTPWMMHMWKYEHGESLYAHGAPAERGGPPAEDPGFETDADPDEEALGPEHLPDALRDRAKDLWRRDR